MRFQVYQSREGRLRGSGPLGTPLRQLMKMPARARGEFSGCWESASLPFASACAEPQADWPPTQPPGGRESPASFVLGHLFDWLHTHLNTLGIYILFWKFPGGPVVRTQRFHCHGLHSQKLRSHKWRGMTENIFLFVLFYTHPWRLSW